MQEVSYISGQDQFTSISQKPELQLLLSTTSDRVIWSGIQLPDPTEQRYQYFNLPEYLKIFFEKDPQIISNTRNVLWQSIKNKDVKINAQYARKIEFAIPYFLSKKEAIYAIQRFSKIFIEDGMILDCSIHDPNKIEVDISATQFINNIQGKENTKGYKRENLDYIGYALCTLRDYKDGGFINKNREWNHLKYIYKWRSAYAAIIYEAMIKSKKSTAAQIAKWSKKLDVLPEFALIKQEINNKINQEINKANLLKNKIEVSP